MNIVIKQEQVKDYKITEEVVKNASGTGPISCRKDV